MLIKDAPISENDAGREILELQHITLRKDNTPRSNRRLQHSRAEPSRQGGRLVELQYDDFVLCISLIAASVFIRLVSIQAVYGEYRSTLVNLMIRLTQLSEELGGSAGLCSLVRDPVVGVRRNDHSYVG